MREIRKIFILGIMVSVLGVVSPNIVHASTDVPTTKSPLVRRIIVTFTGEPVPTATLNAATTVADLKYQTLSAANVRAYRLSHAVTLDSIAQELKTVPGVELVEDSGVMKIAATAAPSDPYFDKQWSMQDPTTDFGINPAPAWKDSLGNGVVVAVLDTGIVAHDDLQGQVLPGYDFVSDFEELDYANDGDGWDSDPTDPGDLCPDDLNPSNSWHGTHVAGIIAAKHNGIGIKGIAPRAKILPVRVLGKCGGTPEDLAAGIRWAAGVVIPGVDPPTQPANIINLSLGSGGEASPDPCNTIQSDDSVIKSDLQNAIDEATANGVLIIAASGNSDTDAKYVSPASCDNVITVSATDKRGGRGWETYTEGPRPFSNFGKVVDIAAPGYQILSTIYETKNYRHPNTTWWYGYESGTSQATPHVAGVAALVWEIVSAGTLTPEQSTADAVTSILTTAVTEFPTLDPADYSDQGGEKFSSQLDCTGKCGSGIVSASQAVATATKMFPPDGSVVGDGGFDVDDDGFNSTEWGGEDCDDMNAAVNPDQPENQTNGIDDNCSGFIDEVQPPAPEVVTAELGVESILVTWDAPTEVSIADPISKFFVTMTDSEDNSVDLCSPHLVDIDDDGHFHCTASNDLLETADELVPGETYTFTVISVSESNLESDGVLSDPVTYYTQPGPVTSPKRTRMNNAVTISWSPPAVTGGVDPSELTYYVTAIDTLEQYDLQQCVPEEIDGGDGGGDITTEGLASMRVINSAVKFASLKSTSGNDMISCALEYLPLGITLTDITIFTAFTTDRTFTGETSLPDIKIPSTIKAESLKATNVQSSSATISWSLNLLSSLDADEFVVMVKGNGAKQFSKTLTRDEESGKFKISNTVVCSEPVEKKFLGTLTGLIQTCTVSATNLTPATKYDISVKSTTGQIYDPFSEAAADESYEGDIVTSTESAKGAFTTAYITKSETRGSKTVKTKSKTAASKLVSGLPTGSRKWSTTGGCSISSTTASNPTVTATSKKGSCSLVVLVTSATTKTTVTVPIRVIS